jgi:hypothetical protein
MELELLGLNFLNCVRTRPVCIRGSFQLTILRIFVILLCLMSSEGECAEKGPLTLVLVFIHNFLLVHFNQ